MVVLGGRLFSMIVLSLNSTNPVWSESEGVRVSTIVSWVTLEVVIVGEVGGVSGSVVPLTGSELVIPLSLKA